MDSLRDVAATWDALARDDPMWAALMDPAKADGGWGVEEFLATGRAEVATVLDHLAIVGGEPDFSGAALDFGCGIGRLTQALAERFATATGVDISPTMIERAKQANRHPDRCRYVLNDRDDLTKLNGDQFCFVYTSVVLQHMPARYSTTYMREFARVLAPGGVLVFQIPDHRSLRERAAHVQYTIRKRIRVRSRLYNTLRRTGLHGGEPITLGPEAAMHCVPETEVRGALDAGGLRIIDVQLTNSTAVDFSGQLRYLDREPHRGFVSKQYCAVKPAPRG